MDGREFLGIFKSLRLHFNQEKYNFFEYPCLNVSDKEYTKSYVLANFLGGKFKTRQEAIDHLSVVFSRKTIWLNEVLDRESLNIVSERKGWLNGFNYNYEQDLMRIRKNGLIQDQITGGYLQMPKVIRLLLDHQIQPETVLCLDHCFNFIGKIDDTLWKPERIRLVKFRPFCSLDRKAVLSITRKIIEQPG